MKYIKLELSKKSVDEKVAQGNEILASMRGNSDFRHPSPSLETFDSIIDTLEAKKLAREQTVEAARAATAALQAAEGAYDRAVSQLAAYSEGAVGCDLEKLEGAGFTIRKNPEPILSLDMVEDLKVSSNSYSGVLHAKWKPLRGAKSYEVQICPDPVVEDNWRSIKPSPASKAEIDRLAPGQKIWVRVRAVAKKLAGPWSQPAGKVVP
jgi:hypothetical protein